MTRVRTKALTQKLGDCGPAARPVVLHIPHSSLAIPKDIQRNFLVSDEILAREVLLMTDHFTNEIFWLPGHLAARLVYPFSRLVADPERFPDDEREPMASKGMGAVYSRTSAGEPLRNRIAASEREAILDRFYWPHHEVLIRLVAESLNVHGRCLILDCHSFASSPLPHESDQGALRPEICLGSDVFHTPGYLVSEAQEAFTAAGFITEVNRPFGGALVPSQFYYRDTCVTSLMIEVNRHLYMDERAGRRLPTFWEFCKQFETVLKSITQRFLAEQPPGR